MPPVETAVTKNLHRLFNHLWNRLPLTVKVPKSRGKIAHNHLNYLELQPRNRTIFHFTFLVRL